MKKRQRFSLILIAAWIFSLLSAPALAAGAAAVDAVPVRYALTVDGGEISLWAYEICGGPYFKLRDLAMALSGTEKRFGVTWDGSANAVSLTTGAAYTPVGGELSEPSQAAARAPSTRFYMDGKEIPMRSYIINGAHYIPFHDLAANIRFSPALDAGNRFAKINTKVYDAGLYRLFYLPEGWRADGPNVCLSFTRSGAVVGSLCVLTYEPGAPISQFQGSHAETLSSGELSGLAYPAARALIRRTRPAAAQDDSHVDELHIYILLADSGCAFDFSFDAAEVDERTAMEIVQNFSLDEPAVMHNAPAALWAKAVQARDGRAQYDLLSKKLQAEFYDFYEAMNWVTGVSSPWVESYTIEIIENQAVVFYKNTTSAGSAGYTVDILSFSEEDGQLKISAVDGYNNR